MLGRIVGRSLVRRCRRKALTLLAVSLGIAVATAVGTIALDVGDKVSRELRSFGANISVAPVADSLPVRLGGVDYRPAASGAFLAEADLVKLKRIFWRHNIVAFAPFLYAPATINGRRVALVGAWFNKSIRVDEGDVFQTGLKELHPTWKVEGHWPEDDELEGCLVGRRLAEALGARPGDALAVAVAAVYPSRLGVDDRRQDSAPRPSRSGVTERRYNAKAGATAPFVVRGILETGGPEENQLFVPLATLQRLTGLEGKVRRVEVSALTKPEDNFARSDLTRLTPEEFDRWYCTPYVSSIAYQIQQVIPGAEAKPVHRVAETEGRILDRVGVLMALLAVAALITAALAVASMMLATVLERRVEIGLFKSLGASDARVALVFLLEAGVVGVLGGVAGYLAGSLLARHLAAALFGTPANIHWIIFPGAVALAVLVTLAGSAVPLARGLRLSPVTVLRNE